MKETVVADSRQTIEADPARDIVSDHRDFSLAVAGLAGWSALAPDEEHQPTGLLDRSGFRKLKNKEDEKRFRLFQGRR